MYKLTANYNLSQTSFHGNESNSDKNSLRYIVNMKYVKSTNININHLPDIIVGKIFQYLPIEQLLVSAPFSNIFFNEAKRIIERLNNVGKMDLILNLPKKNSIAVHR